MGVGLKGITFSSWLVQQLEFWIGFSSLWVALARPINSFYVELLQKNNIQHMNSMEPWKLVGPVAPVLQFVEKNMSSVSSRSEREETEKTPRSRI